VGDVDARAVGRHAHRRGDAGQRGLTRGGAGREVDRRHPAAGGDVGPRPVRNGRDGAGAARERDAGSDPVGRDVEQRGLGAVEPDDHDARVGGGGCEEGER